MRGEGKDVSHISSSLNVASLPLFQREYFIFFCFGLFVISETPTLILFSFTDHFCAQAIACFEFLI